jgi:hypothetical protein
MAIPNRTGVPEKTSQTEQYVLNYSFDEVYKILMVGLAAYNSGTGNYDRLQIDSSGGIKTSATGGLIPMAFDDIQFSNADANGNYQTGVVKSAGATVCTLTFAYDGSSNVTRVTRT